MEDIGWTADLISIVTKLPCTVPFSKLAFPPTLGLRQLFYVARQEQGVKKDVVREDALPNVVAHMEQVRARAKAFRYNESSDSSSTRCKRERPREC